MLDPSSLILRFAPQLTLGIRMLYNLTETERSYEKRVWINTAAVSMQTPCAHSCCYVKRSQCKVTKRVHFTQAHVSHQSA